MTEADHVAAVRAAPEDEGLRLAYADWLKKRRDKGDRARGAYLRAAIEFDRLVEEGPERAALRQRAHEAWQQAAQPWRDYLGPDLRRPQYRRGLPERVEVDAATFLGEAELLFRRLPLRGVWLKEALE